MDPRLDCSQCVRGPFSRDLLHNHGDHNHHHHHQQHNINSMGQLNHVFSVPNRMHHGHSSNHERNDGPLMEAQQDQKAVDFSGFRAQMEQMRWRSMLPHPSIYGEREMRPSTNMESHAPPYFNMGGDDLVGFSDPTRQYPDMRAMGFRMFNESCQIPVNPKEDHLMQTPIGIGKKPSEMNPMMGPIPTTTMRPPSQTDNTQHSADMDHNSAMSLNDTAINMAVIQTYPVAGPSGVNDIVPNNGPGPSQPKPKTTPVKKEKAPGTRKTERKPPKRKVIRKRKKDVDNWKRNKNKRLKNHGMEYVGNSGKLIPAKTMGPGCPDTCRYRCQKTFTQEDRDKIFNRFWGLGDITAQRQFILKCVDKIKPIRPSKESRRTKTFMYSLTKNESEYRVCKTFFIHTLGVKEDIVFGAFRKLDDNGLLTPDMRGKHSNHKKVEEDISEMIRQIIHGHFSSETPPGTEIQQKALMKAQKDETDVTGRKKAKKRSRHEELWKRVKFKKLKNHGQQYVSGSGKLIPAKNLGPGCQETCRYHCHQVFPQDLRENIFHRFWALGDITAQRQYIVKYVDKVKPKRPGRKGTESSRRTKTLVYHLGKEGTDYQVCKRFFLDTLGVREDIVFGAFRKLTETGIVAPDLRGKHMNHKKIDEPTKDMVRQHIMSFPTVVSPPAPGKKGMHYLDPQLNITKMYSMYTERCEQLGVPPANMSMYRQIFRTEFNIAFQTTTKKNQSPQQQHQQQQQQHQQQQQQQPQLPGPSMLPQQPEISSLLH